MLISYAQNFEDVILWRALKTVKNGFYIDIGAWSPTLDSVTALFYENGWSGINVEPNPFYYSELQAARKRDINLKVAVADRQQRMQMTFVSSSGLSTLDDEITKKYTAEGWQLDKQFVDALTLPAIWSEHIAAGQDVHFLKIDVEGFENKIIKSHEWQTYRPWVIIVEATLPMSQVPSHDDWEPVLLGNNYDLVYQDGLNRFYLAQEHNNLKAAFDFPPNVFDDFVRYSEAQLALKNQEVFTRNSELESLLQAHQQQLEAVQLSLKLTADELKDQQLKLSQADELYETAKRQLSDKQDQIDALYHSSSWRVTSPLRKLKTMMRHLPTSGARAGLRVPLQKLSVFIMERPKLLNFSRQILIRFPGLKAFLHQLIIGRRLGEPVTHQHYDIQAQQRDFALNALNVRGRKIYTDLALMIADKGE